MSRGALTAARLRVCVCGGRQTTQDYEKLDNGGGGGVYPPNTAPTQRTAVSKR